MILALMHVWREMWSAKTWALVALAPPSFSVCFLDPQESNLHGSPVILDEWDHSGHPGRHPATSGEVDYHFGIFLPTGETVGQVGPSQVWPCACLGRGQCSLECSSSHYPYIRVLLDLCGSTGYFTSPLCSGIFIIMSCLWTVASWSSCEGTIVREWSVLPSWWHYL